MKKGSTFRGKPIREAEYRGKKVRYVADQLIVKLKPQFRNDPEICKKIESALPLNSSFQSDFDELGMAVINLPESTDLFEVARKLEEEDAILFAEPTLMDSGS